MKNLISIIAVFTLTLTSAFASSTSTKSVDGNAGGLLAAAVLAVIVFIIFKLIFSLKKEEEEEVDSESFKFINRINNIELMEKLDLARKGDDEGTYLVYGPFDQ